MADGIKIQPTILVKKTDGTSERITLEEFRKRKSTSVLVAPEKSQIQRRAVPLIEETEEVVAAQPQKTLQKNNPQTVVARRAIPLIEDPEIQVTGNREQGVKVNVPALQAENHVALTAPVVRVFEQPTSAKLTAEPRKKSLSDHLSLLEEDTHEIHSLEEKHQTTHAPTHSVSFSSTVAIAPDLKARLDALVLSWKKGIRDQHQFLDYAMRPAKDGGLGLTIPDAQTLFRDISGNAALQVPKSPPRVAPRPALAGASKLSPVPQERPYMSPVPQGRSVIREISSEETGKVMGPTEESAAFTIQDFRRLSRNPKTAGEMLLAKFSGWKDESYLLYLQVRDSWRQSPLFHLYIEKTTDALVKNIPILTVLEGTDLTYEEYVAISEVSHKLAMMD